MDIDKRKNMMLSNYVKRNVFIKNVMEAYEKEYNTFKQRQLKLEKRQNTDNKGIGDKVERVEKEEEITAQWY